MTYRRLPRRRGYGFRDRFWDNLHVAFIVLFLCLMLLNGATVLKEWNDCSNRGGHMVQGLSWNGYVCVEGK